MDSLPNLPVATSFEKTTPLMTQDQVKKLRSPLPPHPALSSSSTCRWGLYAAAWTSAAGASAWDRRSSTGSSSHRRCPTCTTEPGRECERDRDRGKQTTQMSLGGGCCFFVSTNSALFTPMLSPKHPHDRREISVAIRNPAISKAWRPKAHQGGRMLR